MSGERTADLTMEARGPQWVESSEAQVECFGQSLLPAPLAARSDEAFLCNNLQKIPLDKWRCCGQKKEQTHHHLSVKCEALDQREEAVEEH